ncbi:MAG: ABC transporter permease [Saprospiraceae bacterium]|nr:ABC transporter permease [Saprospiraceae bacterium]
MFRNYLKIAFRNLLKHRVFTFINIFGLAIGVTVFLLIAQFVWFERSYENFISNADNIYRVKLETFVNNELAISSAENYPGAGPALMSELPEVTGYARLYNLGYKNNVIITNKEAKPDPIAFKHRRFLYADSSFLSMMGYPMAMGDPKTALAEPLSAVISEHYAKLYFGNENPMGKTLQLEDDDYNNELVKITGVFKDLPPNTHLKFDVLFSYKTLFGRSEGAPARYDQSWGRKDMYTFITVKPGTDPRALEAKFPAIVDKYKPNNAQQNQKDILSLQALKDIHLTSDLAEEAEPNGDKSIVFFMGLIGLFVLSIAWINYINLSTARAVERAREVGMRKVVGAYKNQLITQYLVEAGFVNLFAIVLAWVFTLLSLPFFNTLAKQEFDITYLIQPWFLALLLLLWTVGTFLSGFYPAWILSSFKPMLVLKGRLKNSTSGILLRKGLVVVQFMASVVLIVGTIIIYRQLNFMLNQDLGMNIDQVLVVERHGITSRDRTAFNSAIDVFRAELQQNPEIEGVATSVTIPGKQREYKAVVKKMGANDNESVTVRFNSMDYNFMDVFKMELVSGRAFSRDFVSDPDTAVVLTESAARLIGFQKPDDAIGQTLAIPGFGWNPIVVGVVNDYHQVSLKKALDPTIFYCSPYNGEFYSMRIKTNRLSQTINQVESAWQKAFPGNPFEYFFLDEYFAQQYENEKTFGRLSSIFAILAIIVGCLGLFGLSGYTITQRTKEIGIRKVLGASTTGIVALLSKDILWLVLIAILVASPVAWWVMTQWLQDFAYRINVEWWLFVLAGFIAIFIALATVSFQAVRAAWANPVKSLRSE